MEHHWGPLRAKEQHCGLWNIIEGHITPCWVMEHNWVTLRAMEYHWWPLRAFEGHGTPLRAIKGHGTQWRAIEHHCGPWRAMKQRWPDWFFLSKHTFKYISFPFPFNYTYSYSLGFMCSTAVLECSQQIFCMAMFLEFKSETAFKLKSISDSSQVKHFQIKIWWEHSETAVEHMNPRI